MAKSFNETVKSLLNEDNVKPKDDTNDTKNIKTLKPGSKHKEAFGIDAKNRHGMKPNVEDLGAPVTHPFDKNSYGKNSAKNVTKDSGRRSDNRMPGEPLLKLKEQLENVEEDTELSAVLSSLDEESIAELMELEEEQVSELFGEELVGDIISWLNENVEIVEEVDIDDLSEEEIDEIMESDEFSEELNAIAEELGIEDIDNLNEEELTELSRKTLQSYVNKSVNPAPDARKKAITGDDSSLKKAWKARRKGLNTATKKIMQKGGVVKEEGEDFPFEIDMKEDVNALFEGEELTEEFKTKATTVFEAAVTSKLREYQKVLDEAFVESLEEATEELTESLEGKVKKYMEYVAEEWMEENEVAIENTLRNELTEDFIAGLRNLFIEHYIDIPEDKIDVVDELAEQVEKLKSKLDEEVSEKLELRKELNEALKNETLLQVSENLTSTQFEKLVDLTEDVEYTTEEEFTNKVGVIMEKYFGKKGTTVPTTLHEENADTGEPITEGRMERYVQELSRQSKS